MKRKYQYISFLLVFAMACNNKNSNTNAKVILKNIEQGTDSTRTREYFHNNKTDLLKTFGYYHSAPVEISVFYNDTSDMKVGSIETYILNKPHGHYFEFYPNGNIKFYCYNISAGNNSYERHYTSEGKLSLEVGNPFVDWIFTNSDSVYMYFTTVFQDSFAVEVSTFKNAQIGELSLKKSQMQPMLLESTFPVTDSILFLKITASINNRKDTIYNDTLNTR
jgi:hypothetical protein